LQSGVPPFRISFADLDEWNRQYRAAMLDHNTGGPLNSKLLFFFENWDEIDDFWAFFLAQFPGRYPDDAARAFSLIREHDDVIWVPLPATDPM